MSEKKRTRRRSYVVQEQEALNDAAAAMGKEIEVSQIKLIQRRLESLAGPAEAERQRTLANLRGGTTDEVARLRAENTALKEEIEQLKNTQSVSKERSLAESFDAVVARVGEKNGNQKNI